MVKGGGRAGAVFCFLLVLLRWEKCMSVMCADDSFFPCRYSGSAAQAVRLRHCSGEWGISSLNKFGWCVHFLKNACTTPCLLQWNRADESLFFCLLDADSEDSVII